jgi:hypothetical protein
MFAFAARFGPSAAMAAAAGAFPYALVYGIGENPYGTPTGYQRQMPALDKAREKMRENTQVAKLVFGIGVVPTKVVAGPTKVVAATVNDIIVYPNGNGFVAHMHKDA